LDFLSTLSRVEIVTADLTDKDVQNFSFLMQDAIGGRLDLIKNEDIRI